MLNNNTTSIIYACIISFICNKDRKSPEKLANDDVIMGFNAVYESVCVTIVAIK